MALGLVLDGKILALAPGKLGGAGLLGVEMVKARLARKHLAVFGQLKPLAV